jgi:hypothetical protein
MGLQQSRSAGGNDETRVRPKSSNLSERLSASFPRLQKTRGSNSVASTTEGKARKTGDAARGENGSETPELSAPDSVSSPGLPFLSAACACGCVSPRLSLLTSSLYLVVLLTAILVQGTKYRNASISHSPLPGMSLPSIIARASARQRG